MGAKGRNHDSSHRSDYRLVSTATSTLIENQTLPQTNQSRTIVLGERLFKLRKALNICIGILVFSTISHLAIVGTQQLVLSDRILPNKKVTLVGNLHDQPKQQILSNSGLSSYEQQQQQPQPQQQQQQHKEYYHNDYERPIESLRQASDLMDGAINDGQAYDYNNKDNHDSHYRPGSRHVKRSYRDADGLIDNKDYSSNYLMTDSINVNLLNGSLSGEVNDESVRCSNTRLDPITDQVICERSKQVSEADYDDSTGYFDGAPVRSRSRQWRFEPQSRADREDLPMTPTASHAQVTTMWPQKVRRSDRADSQVEDVQRVSRANTYRVSAEQLKRFLIAQQSIIDPYGLQYTRTSSPPFILTPAVDETGGPQQQQPPQQDTDGSLSARKREQHRIKSNSVTGAQSGGGQETGAISNLVVAQGTTASAGPIDAATDMASETPLECQMRQFSFTASKTDPRTGNTCSGMIVANICYGACDTGEIADWLFPHKKSIHKVCRHGARVRRRALLTDCTGEDVDESTRDYHYVDARSCVCQKCSSIDTACLGSLTRPYLPQGGGTAASKQLPAASTTNSNESSLSQSSPASGSLVSELGNDSSRYSTTTMDQQQQ